MTIQDFFNSPKSYTSRKLVFSLGTAVLIFVGMILAAQWPSMGAHYGSMIGGLIATLVVYTGGNVTSAMVNTKFLNGAISNHEPLKAASGTIESKVQIVPLVNKEPKVEQIEE
jgi:predicted anti-sigma-YlaC factor YlaD